MLTDLREGLFVKAIGEAETGDGFSSSVVQEELRLGCDRIVMRSGIAFRKTFASTSIAGIIDRLAVQNSRIDGSGAPTSRGQYRAVQIGNPSSSMALAMLS